VRDRVQQIHGVQLIKEVHIIVLNNDPATESAYHFYYYRDRLMAIVSWSVLVLQNRKISYSYDYSNRDGSQSCGSRVN